MKEINTPQNRYFPEEQVRRSAEMRGYIEIWKTMRMVSGTYVKALKDARKESEAKDCERILNEKREERKQAKGGRGRAPAPRESNGLP